MADNDHDTNPITHAREHYRNAVKELKEREWGLANALIDQVQEDLKWFEGGMGQTIEMLKEIPGQPSLDHTGEKREAIKELEDIGRRLQALSRKVELLRGVAG